MNKAGIIRDKTKLLNNLKSLKRRNNTSAHIAIDVPETPLAQQLYQNILTELSQIEKMCEELKVLQLRQVKITFGDTSSLQKQILRLNQQTSIKIQHCATTITHMSSMDCDSPISAKIVNNMKQLLTERLKDITQAMNKQQHRFVKLHETTRREEGGTFLHLSNDKQVEMEMGLLSPSTIDRGADIERIVSTISELSEVFKSLNALVIDQGTLVDRIDYNIDRTYTFVQQSKVQLQQANHHQGSAWANNCIVALVALILFFSMVLTFKYSKLD